MGGRGGASGWTGGRGAKSGRATSTPSAMASTIRTIINEGEYEYYGIRTDYDVNYAVGDYTADSRVWDNGEPTEDTLDGTSVVGIRWNATDAEIATAIKAAQNYFGNRVYLVGGNDMEYGEDAGEYIIKEAKVLKRLR